MTTAVRPQTEQSLRTVAEVVGATLHRLGLREIFGVVGSGNYVVTAELVRRGARYVSARHELGAGMMADAHARVTGRVTALSVHQGCGLTNALTAITEAAKSRTPLLVLTGDTPPTAKTSNFWIDQEATLLGLGVEVAAVRSAATAVKDTVRAYQRARDERRTVVLNLPLDVQEQLLAGDPGPDLPLGYSLLRTPESQEGAELVARALLAAERPVILGGRGALGAREELVDLADRSGALLATTAVARGLFQGHPWSVDVMGGFATPAAAELITDADLVVAFGAGLNGWTTRHGALLEGSTVIVVDSDPDAIGFHHEPDHAIVADSGAIARAAGAIVGQRAGVGYRTDAARTAIDTGGRWSQVPYEDTSTTTHLDPRTLSIAVDGILPTDRVVAADGGNFIGYPSMYLSVPDARSFVFPQAFQSIGLALGAAIGAAVARPDVVTVAAVGDGGFMMSLTELDTAVRLGLRLLVLVYDDAAYGAELHHFDDDHDALRVVTFPDTDIAAIARGFGAEAITARTVEDLTPIRDWVERPDSGPLLVDAKITSFPSWVLAHAFKGEK
ncbi:thiamine pyrophosphate-binding protein [Ornithinimicrobium humiphilum]|uniref:Thiamine pyrophosphate-dependent acetolactate synthase large subunit-like protein n=1 Tax=Ornithinimicrobium humiphilum TaxID=125288 RepID=A0A543KRU1_9MICO|nr:thiamine pyrophosphate-binding protein [Ornithinimicrobium humiphilum]TQM97792.1 thiamine pyrophosphate-dependent acetolactate synthase large subunit-like protein [Ornithinimicrobium humiphilum]